MQEPTLVIMAAGMGSRYGGLKQIDPMTSEGEIIMDFSLYDAMMAGFQKVIFVIKEEMEEDFRALMDPRAGKYLDLRYAFQKIDDLPEGFAVPEGREKPWGTGHAVMACRDLLDGPFAVINADDFYGPAAFQTIYQFLAEQDTPDGDRFCMVAYRLRNTITENGHVARGVCAVSESGLLEHVVERKKIQRVDGVISYTEDDGATWIPLEEDTPVSMNFWGYTLKMMEKLVDGFPAFLEETLQSDPVKGEYLIPAVTDQMIQSGEASVRVLYSDDLWHGVTYQADKEDVMAALQSMKDRGLYPEKLWK